MKIEGFWSHLHHSSTVYVLTLGGSKAIYTLAAKKLGEAPMKCIVVEDTAIGATAGKAAGMKAGV